MRFFTRSPDLEAQVPNRTRLRSRTRSHSIAQAISSQAPRSRSHTRSMSAAPGISITQPRSAPISIETKHQDPLLISNTPNPQILKMDALVSQYSHSAYQDEGYSSDEQLQLSEVTPSLSLKFALPPIAQVHLSTSLWTHQINC